jgi:hypothetical protein
MPFRQLLLVGNYLMVSINHSGQDYLEVTYSPSLSRNSQHLASIVGMSFFPLAAIEISLVLFLLTYLCRTLLLLSS